MAVQMSKAVSVKFDILICNFGLARLRDRKSIVKYCIGGVRSTRD